MEFMKRIALISFAVLVGCQGASERGLPAATASERHAARMLEGGRVDEARAMFVQAAQQSARPFLASIGLARCGIRRGVWAETEAALQQAYAWAPGTPEATDLLGRTHLEAAKASSGGRRRQHATTASTLFSSASRQAPELPSLPYHAGLSELLAGRAQFAVPLLEAAHRKDPSAEDPLHALILSWRRLGQRQPVRKLLEPLEKAGRLPGGLQSALAWAREAPSKNQ